MTTSDWTAKCDLCPRNCLADRNTGLGTCRSGDMITVAKSMLHFWEEPCISGKEGSGAVFFSGCALHCVYCQNNMISEGETGERISVNRLTEMFFELAALGAVNINLVTGDHFIPLIAQAVSAAKSEGFDRPFLFNCSGYEKPESTRRNSVRNILPQGSV